MTSAPRSPKPRSLAAARTDPEARETTRPETISAAPERTSRWREPGRPTAPSESPRAFDSDVSARPVPSASGFFARSAGSAADFFDSTTRLEGPAPERDLPSSDAASSRSVEVAEVSSADDEIGEAWMEARTVLGAPSFAVLAAERAAAESASFQAPAEEAPLDPFESLETQHDAPSLASIEIPIDVDEPEPVALEVSIAPQSESAVWESLEGELGVFLATYDELPIGTEVRVTVHLTGERPFESRARVVWLRNAPGLWPGLGLRLIENRPDVWFRLQRFSQRWRAPMFQ